MEKVSLQKSFQVILNDDNLSFIVVTDDIDNTKKKKN